MNRAVAARPWCSLAASGLEPSRCERGAAGGLAGADESPSAEQHRSAREAAARPGQPVACRVPAEDIVDTAVAAGDFATLVAAVSGESATLEVDGRTELIEGTTVVKADVPCSNGVIHPIDAVILPE